MINQLSTMLQVGVLDIDESRSFLELISPDNILIGVVILAAGILIIITSIYIHLFLKKRRYFYATSIKNNLQVWISHIILDESGEAIELPTKFYRILKNKSARQFAIDELINCKKNFSGAVGTKVVQLYDELNLKKDSLKKIRNKRKWHIKAKGIQELYLMEQRDTLKKIYKNTNNQNEFVRTEAQTGVIHMTGFPGLRFLDVISYPLTEWQQIKLLEQLRLTGKRAGFAINNKGWLLSKNNTVVIFALKLIGEYQQLTLLDNVIACIDHSCKEIRTQAVKTLILLADERTPAVLSNYLAKEFCTDRFLILDSMAELATGQQEDFLLTLLDDPDDIIKLKSAIALVNCSLTGIEKLEERIAQSPETFSRILKHVKSVK